MTRPSGVQISTLVAAAAMALAACGGGSADDSAPAAEAPAVTDSAETTDPLTTNLAGAGQCGIVVDRDDEIDEYDPISCDQPHDAEFAGLATTDVEPTGEDNLELTVELVSVCASVVSALGKQSLDGYGLNVGTIHEAGSVGPDNVECWAETASPGVLLGSLTEVEFGAALGDNKVLQSGFSPGECYLAMEVGFDIVVPAACDVDGVEQFVSAVALAGDDYPGDDEVLEMAFALCDEERADADFELISDQSAVVRPSAVGWRALDQRGVICVMLPADPDAPTGDEESAASDTANAEQPCANSSDDSFASVDCDEPHGAEFAGMIAPPADMLPEDSDEATTLMIQACQPIVEALVGRDLTKPGIGLGFAVDSGLGDPITDDISCFVNTNTDNALIGRISDLGLDGVLTQLIVADQAPGTCFLLGEDSFALGAAADCSNPDALMFIGNITLDDGPFPGDDAIRELRTVVCGELLADSGLAADPATVSGTFPSESDWNNLDRRNLACDATPL